MLYLHCYNSLKTLSVTTFYYHYICILLYLLTLHFVHNLAHTLIAISFYLVYMFCLLSSFCIFFLVLHFLVFQHRSITQLCFMYG
nr:MAG TPA: hypothetical protein [Caudoviricetes sp.]